MSEEKLKNIFIAVDPATKDGDYTCMVQGTYNKNTGILNIKKVNYLNGYPCAVKSNPKGRILSKDHAADDHISEEIKGR